MSKQQWIIVALLALLSTSYWFQRPKETTAMKMTDLTSVFIILENEAESTPDGSIPDPFPAAYGPITRTGNSEPMTGEWFLAYSAETTVPAGSRYCQLSIAQAFKLTLLDERSSGILINPGFTAHESLVVPDSDIVAADHTLTDRSEKPFVVKAK